MLQINPAKHFLHAVPGGDLEGGIGKGDPEIRIGDEKDLERGIDGGDQAPDVGLETETAAGVLKHHERVGVGQGYDLQVHGPAIRLRQKHGYGMEHLGGGSGAGGAQEFSNTRPVIG